MQKFIDEYIEHLALDKGLKEDTIKAYRRYLNSFCEYAYKNGVGNIEQIDRKFVRDYVAGVENNSVNKRYQILSALRLFGRWLERQGKKNILTYLDLPKVPKRIGEVLTEEEVERMLNIAKERRDIEALCIISVLYGSGIRMGALLGLRNQDVDIRNGNLRILKDKGDKEHYALVGKEALGDIKRYWQTRYGDKEPKPDDSLFPLSKFEVNRNLKFYASLAGITKHVTCHTFRRTFATVLLNRGAGILEIAELMHHSNVSTTASHYAKLSVERMREDYEKHPRSATTERLEREEKNLLRRLAEVREKLGKSTKIMPLEENDIHSEIISEQQRIEEWRKWKEEWDAKQKEALDNPPIRLREAAEILGISTQTLIKLAKEKRVNAKHERRLDWFFKRKEIEALKDSIQMLVKIKRRPYGRKACRMVNTDPGDRYVPPLQLERKGIIPLTYNTLLSHAKKGHIRFKVITLSKSKPMYFLSVNHLEELLANPPDWLKKALKWSEACRAEEG